MNFNIRIFIISIGLAALLWLVNHLNREYTVNIAFNIQYEGLPFSENNPPDSTISAEITGSGFALIRYYYEQPTNITLTRQDFKAFNNGDSVFLKVIFDNLSKSIIRVLPTGIKLRNVPNDTLTVSYISYPSKNVPINVRLNISMDDGCLQCGSVKIIPNIAHITGPAERLRHIDSIFTVPVDLSGVCDTIRRKVKIAPLNDAQVKCNIAEIHVLVPICQVKQTELQLHYNLTYAGRIYDGDVTVTLMAPAGIHETNIELDNKISTNRIMFGLKNPAGYKIISISPESIPIEP